MVASLRPSEPTLRLVAQLHALSEVMESLAFRVVELEERFAALELKLQPGLQESSPGAGLLDSDHWLLDTESRLARLESWLSGAGDLRHPADKAGAAVDGPIDLELAA